MTLKTMGLCNLNRTASEWKGCLIVFKVLASLCGLIVLLLVGALYIRHHIDMAREELAFDDAISYTPRGHGLQHS